MISDHWNPVKNPRQLDDLLQKAHNINGFQEVYISLDKGKVHITYEVGLHILTHKKNILVVTSDQGICKKMLIRDQLWQILSKTNIVHFFMCITYLHDSQQKMKFAFLQQIILWQIIGKYYLIFVPSLQFAILPHEKQWQLDKYNFKKCFTINNASS